MDFISIIILVANIITCVGTIQLIRAVIQNRTMLNGYSLSGAFLTFIALVMFNVVWAMLGGLLNMIAVGIGAITVAYWFFVVIFKLYYRKPKVTVKPVEKTKDNWFS